MTDMMTSIHNFNYQITKNPIILRVLNIDQNIISSTRFRFLSYELIELIYYYVLVFNKTANIIRKYTKSYIKRKVMLMDTYMRSTLFPVLALFSKDIKVSVLRTFNACKCCAKHQINKPKTLKKWIESEPNSVSNTDLDSISLSCDCPCRHQARWICRYI